MRADGVYCSARIGEVAGVDSGLALEFVAALAKIG